MLRRSLLSFIVLLLAVTKFYGQQHPVNINYEVNLSRDTIIFFVNKPAETKKGTLLFIAGAGDVAKDSFFFPVIDTSSLYALAIPAAYHITKLDVQAYFYPQLFEIKGSVQRKLKGKNIKAVLITDNKRLYNKPIQLNDNNEFSLPGLVFQDKATLVFVYEHVEKDGYPDVLIDRTPVFEDFKDNVFSGRIQLSADTQQVTEPILPIVSNKPAKPFFVKPGNKFSSTLKNVTVRSTLNKAEKFSKENSTGVFQDANEKIIDCLSNDDILNFTDMLSFLRTRVPGMTSSVNNLGESYLMWRGHETKAFFIDEIPVDLEQMLAVNVADVAIIKAYPPPFFGAGGAGDGGGITVYTRIGSDRRPSRLPNKWIFQINGYSPAIHVLFAE